MPRTKRNRGTKSPDKRRPRFRGDAAHAQSDAAGVASDRRVVMMKVSEIRVDPKLKDLVPRPGLPELQALRESIREHGVRDPIHVRASDHLAIDGHTRLDICREQKRVG